MNTIKKKLQKIFTVSNWKGIFAILLLSFSIMAVNCGGGGGTTNSNIGGSDTGGGSDGGNGGTGGTGGYGEFTGAFSLSGKVMKGAVRYGSVRIYTLEADGNRGDSLVWTNTEETGSFSIDLETGSPTGCILIEVEGGIMTDEATGLEEAFDIGELTAVTCDLSSTVSIAVTPLTTMAAERARTLALEGTPLSIAVASANINVSQQYSLSSIVTVIPVDPTDSDAVLTASLEQRRYGLILAGLSQLANSLGTRSMYLVMSLSSDISDGILDGTDDGYVITYPLNIGGDMVSLSPSAGTSDLQAALDAFAASDNNQTNLGDVQINSNPVEIGVNTAGGLYVTSTSLPAWESGVNGSAALAAAGGSPPYTWALTSGSVPDGFALDGNGIISGSFTLAPGSTMYISPPFTVTVTDSVGGTAYVMLSVTVVAPGPVITVQDCPTGNQYQPYSCQSASATGGTSPYYYTLETGGGFPPMGLSLGTNGVVSGTPTVSGTYSFVICAVDLAGAQDCENATITINQDTVSPFDGTWSGSYSYVNYNGDGGCTYNSGGSMTVTIDVQGDNITGTASVDGWQLLVIPGCSLHSYVAPGGTINGTVSGNSATGSFNFSIPVVGGTWNPSFDATLNGDTISGTLTAGGSGTFSITKQ